jgi:hypothetical protein
MVRHSIVRSPTLIAPDEMDVLLPFRDTNAFSGASSLLIRRYTPNAAYDVNPIVGSTESYGFDEYAALYAYYRVIGYSYSIQMVNMTTRPATSYVLNTNTDPSLSGTNINLYATNPYCQTRLLGPSPSSTAKHIFRGRHQVAQILGSKVVETDDNFRALTTAIPADLVWLSFALENNANSIDVEVIVDIKMQVRFYSREIDLTLSGLEARIKKIKEARARTQFEKTTKMSKN